MDKNPDTQQNGRSWKSEELGNGTAYYDYSVTRVELDIGARVCAVYLLY